MAITTHPEALETSTTEAPSKAWATSRAGLFGWLAVAVALVVATVLVVRVVSADDALAPQPWYSVEHGSIAAIDHAARATASSADVSAENGSITALDHEAEEDTTGVG